MPEALHITVDGTTHEVAVGTTVAAAILLSGQAMRTSVSGEPRSALCGTGICFECRATVNGVAHKRTCQMPCEEGMTVETAR